MYHLDRCNLYINSNRVLHFGTPTSGLVNKGLHTVDVFRNFGFSYLAETSSDILGISVAMCCETERVPNFAIIWRLFLITVGTTLRVLMCKSTYYNTAFLPLLVSELRPLCSRACEQFGFHYICKLFRTAGCL